jgi:hypothetical protein
MLAPFCFCIFISFEHVIIYKNVVPVCLQNTSGLTVCKLRIFEKYASGWLPAGCKLHLASGLEIQNTQFYQYGMWPATN